MDSLDGVVRAGLTLLLGLLVALALAAVARIVFRPGSPARRRGGSGHYGLLVEVTSSSDAGAAEALCRRLAAAGVRATCGPAAGPVQVSADGWVRPRPTSVLVFPDQLERARQVLARSAS